MSYDEALASLASQVATLIEFGQNQHGINESISTILVDHKSAITDLADAYKETNKLMADKIIELQMKITALHTALVDTMELVRKLSNIVKDMTSQRKAPDRLYLSIAPSTN